MDRNLVARIATSIILLFMLFFLFQLGDWAIYFLAISLALLSCKELSDIIRNKFFYVVLIFIVIIIPYSSLIYIYSHNKKIFIWLMMCIWTTDIFAYFVGKFIGGKKIVKIISPNKTWSGFIGGTLATVLLGCTFAYFLKLPYKFWVFGLVVALVTQLSDFFESGLKRINNVKDSGKILPGHGGILDRMDGIIFTAPLFALLY